MFKYRVPLTTLTDASEEVGREIGEILVGDNNMGRWRGRGLGEFGNVILGFINEFLLTNFLLLAFNYQFVNSKMFNTY